jgi:hypothetical protein
VADDRYFWGLLSRRINAVLAGCKDDNLRFLWVDDIIPQTDLPRSDDQSICAIAFVSEDSGRSFEKYRFTMALGTTAAEAFRRRELPALIPEDSTDWLSVDRARKEIMIELR